MEVKFIQKRKNAVELEFNDKTLPNALNEALAEGNVDSYVYEPHPLVKGYRLRVEAADALKELESAIAKVEKEWVEFSKLFKKELSSKK